MLNIFSQNAATTPMRSPDKGDCIDTHFLDVNGIEHIEWELPRDVRGSMIGGCSANLTTYAVKILVRGA